LLLSYGKQDAAGKRIKRNASLSSFSLQTTVLAIRLPHFLSQYFWGCLVDGSSVHVQLSQNSPMRRLR